MGQGISDIFYPDKLNRRDRALAEQLRNDIKAYCNSEFYDEIKKARYLLHQWPVSSFLTLPTEVMTC
jgi:hypothetical protein